jgi:hypothetical protein
MAWHIKSRKQTQCIGKHPTSHSPVHTESDLIMVRRDAICPLGSAALGLLTAFTPLVGARAQTNVAESSFDVRYFYFNDRQDASYNNSSTDRMDIHAPMFRIATPLSDSSHLQGTFVVDDMTGASPLYLDTLSGASARDIEDTRTAGSMVYTYQLESFEVQLGAEASFEDDYDATGVSLIGTTWSEDKNRSLSVGVSSSFDDITSTNNATLDEFRRTFGAYLGYTQVIDANSIWQLNIQGTTADGFLTDQYKLGDARPRSRDSMAFLVRYNRYIEDIDSALHLDYRYFQDTWNILAHTVELSLHTELLTDFIIRPLIRYYTQRDAYFFSNIYPQSESTLFGRDFFSADPRMAGFGGVSLGLKMSYNVSSSVMLDVMYEFYKQSSQLRSFDEGSSRIPDLYAQFMGCGVRLMW